MSIASKYNPVVAWRTLALNVFQLTRETVQDAATYRLTVKAIDTNNPGANQKEIGYYLIDYVGVPYSIIAVDTNTVDVSDDFRTGKCPTAGQTAIIYKSVFKGRGLYLAPDNLQNLHPVLALANLHKYEMALLWGNDANVKKVPFTALLQPIIEDYQVEQVDPEDAAKTLNYAEDFGENPGVRCIITVDANTEYQLQQMPQFTKVDGLIDTIFFDLQEELTGYILISKS
jgi:hypothetical protein